jgi:hypothetical protein
MLNTVSFPQLPFSCITIMSLDGKFSWFQLSVLSIDLMRVMILVLLGSLECFVG